MHHRQIAVLHLVAGIEETVVEYWFAREGEHVQAHAPLITLRHRNGLTFTLRAPRRGPIAGAVIEQILRTEGTAVSATEPLAVLTSTRRGKDRIVAQPGRIEPAAFPYTAEIGIEGIVTPHLVSGTPCFDASQAIAASITGGIHLHAARGH